MTWWLVIDEAARRVDDHARAGGRCVLPLRPVGLLEEAAEERIAQQRVVLGARAITEMLTTPGVTCAIIGASEGMRWPSTDGGQRAGDGLAVSAEREGEEGGEQRFHGIRWAERTVRLPDSMRARPAAGPRR